MANYTLTYSEKSNGWPSFYSFVPEFMMGMNNDFYTFDGGNLWLHNSGNVYNNFYGVQYNSTIKSVINQEALESKLFRTFVIEGDDPWTGSFDSDLQQFGDIDQDWYEKRENSWYGYIRNTGATPALDGEYALRSAKGIGLAQSTSSGTQISAIISFSTSPHIIIPSSLAIGDIIYYSVPPYVTPILYGTVTDITVDIPGGLNYITVDATAGTWPIPIQNPLVFYLKNATAESNGVLGHYLEFELTSDETVKTEMIGVKAETVKSYT